jgi:glycosyltransferase involved in cell wall biosynthesis
LLVRAFDAVAADDADLRLVVAGPDGWGVDAFTAALAQAHHRDRVVRLGWVTDEVRADLLAGATAFAFPSVYEGFGLPPLEAMAAGVPVITTRAGALPETVGDAAVLVEPGDLDALAEAIALVTSDDARRAELVEAGRARAALFSWDETAASMVRLYRSLC